MDDDSIKKLLESTGLSCDDLLTKLLKFKQISNAQKKESISELQNENINSLPETNKNNEERNSIHLELNNEISSDSSSETFVTNNLNLSNPSKNNCDNSTISTSCLIENFKTDLKNNIETEKQTNSEVVKPIPIDGKAECNTATSSREETDTGLLNEGNNITNATKKTELNTLVVENKDVALPKLEATITDDTDCKIALIPHVTNCVDLVCDEDDSPTKNNEISTLNSVVDCEVNLQIDNTNNVEDEKNNECSNERFLKEENSNTHDINDLENNYDKTVTSSNIPSFKNEHENADFSNNDSENNTKESGNKNEINHSDNKCDTIIIKSNILLENVHKDGVTDENGSSNNKKEEIGTNHGISHSQNKYNIPLFKRKSEIVVISSDDDCPNKKEENSNKHSENKSDKTVASSNILLLENDYENVVSDYNNLNKKEENGRKMSMEHSRNKCHQTLENLNIIPLENEPENADISDNKCEDKKEGNVNESTIKQSENKWDETVTNLNIPLLENQSVISDDVSEHEKEGNANKLDIDCSENKSDEKNAGSNILLLESEHKNADVSDNDGENESNGNKSGVNHSEKKSDKTGTILNIFEQENVVSDNDSHNKREKNDNNNDIEHTENECNKTITNLNIPLLETEPENADMSDNDSLNDSLENLVSNLTTIITDDERCVQDVPESSSEKEINLNIFIVALPPNHESETQSKTIEVQVERPENIRNSLDDELQNNTNDFQNNVDIEDQDDTSSSKDVESSHEDILEMSTTTKIVTGKEEQKEIEMRTLNDQNFYDCDDVFTEDCELLDYNQIDELIDEDEVILIDDDIEEADECTIIHKNETNIKKEKFNDNGIPTTNTLTVNNILTDENIIEEPSGSVISDKSDTNVANSDYEIPTTNTSTVNNILIDEEAYKSVISNNNETNVANGDYEILITNPSTDNNILIDENIIEKTNSSVIYNNNETNITNDNSEIPNTNTSTVNNNLIDETVLEEANESVINNKNGTNITNDNYKLPTTNTSTVNNQSNSNSSSDKEDSIEDSSHSALKDDEIRNILKLQLSSLRNRKINREVSNTTKTLQLMDTTERNRKKKLISDDNFHNVSDLPVKVKPSENKTDLVTMSGETSFVISSVAGGVEIDENDVNDIFQKEESIVLTKTTDVKKIKGWKNKNFVLQNPLILSTSKSNLDCTNDFEQASTSSRELNIFKNFGSNIKQFSEEMSSNCLASTSSCPLEDNNANDCIKIDETCKNPIEELRKIINKNKDSEKKRYSFESDNSNSLNESKMVNVSQPLKDSSNILDRESSNKKSDKSPFVSDSLEEFLNADATLNVSYQLPKLHAEDGIISNYPSEIPKTLFNIKHSESISPEKQQIKHDLPEVKAKTLAEKRRMLEKLKRTQARKEKLMIKKNEINTKNECDSDLSKIRIKVLSEVLAKPTNINKDDVKSNEKSFVLYNNSRLYVPSNLSGVCLAKINDPTSINLPAPIKRLSLLRDFVKNSPKAVKYKPGPLCKKANLQVSDPNNTWLTCIKKLPDIYLEVIPEVGKPLPPEIIHHFPNSVWDINEVQLEFALSAVCNKKIPNKPTHIFKLKIPYGNHEQNILVRKKIKITAPEIFTDVTKTAPANINVEDEVKNIVEDLLNYVELKELSDSFIMDEPTNVANENSPQKLVPLISDNISMILKKPKKRTRIDLELSRLSCKVVNVTLEDNNDDEQCNKPFCLLGCICQSLTCENIFTFHCRKVECMFNCTCPKPRSSIYDAELSLPSGTDLLSNDTVCQIENRAKRYLAKVEREFTQTIIHTNDKTIVIGGKNKTRRATKVPKKYSDYVEVSDNLEPISDFKNIDKIEIDEKFYRKCIVRLPKLKLIDLIPYCLVHNIHNCLCKGRDTGLPPLQNKKTSKREIIESLVNAKKLKLTPPEDEIVVDDYIKPCPASKKKELNETRQNCARTRMVFANYIIRNSTEEYKKKLFRRLRMMSHYSQLDKTEGITILENTVKSDSTNPIVSLNQLMNSSASNVRQRKQSFHIRVDEPNQSKKIQRRKRKKKHATSAISINTNVPHKLFKTEIILPVHKNGEFLKALQVNTLPEGNMRILDWNNLLEGYISNEITVLQHIINKANLLVTPSSRSTPPDFVPLTLTFNTIDLVKWFLCKENPVKKTQLFAVLFPEGRHFILVGFCLKSLDPLVNSMIVMTVNKNNALTNKLKLKLLEAEDVIVSKSESKRCRSLLNPNRNLSSAVDVTENALTEIETFTHRNLNGSSHVIGMVIYKTNLKDKILEEILEEDDDSELKEQIIVPIPNNLNGKWRMLYLRSDFSWLAFCGTKYSIKYNDLMNIVKKSNYLKCTIGVCNREMSLKHGSDLFGIYTIPYYQDRLFIGPYDINDCHDLETLRYMRQELVDTDLFNKMQGIQGVKTAKWFCQKSDPLCTIDLTNEDIAKNSNLPIFIDVPSDSSASTSTQSLLKRKSSGSSDSEPGLKQTRYSKQSFEEAATLVDDNHKLQKVNRYILSNIPHLGYLTAYQNEETGILLVSWPINKKILKFDNTNTALVFLSQRLSIYLQRIPENFVIKLIVIKNVDGNSKPMNSKRLNGYHICGEFGIYDLKTLNAETMKKINVSRQQILGGLYKRTQAICKLQMEELGKILNVVDEMNPYDPETILDKAAEEITDLTISSEKLAVLQDMLEQRKRQQTSEILKLLQNFPQSQRLVELKKLKSYTHYSSKSKKQSPIKEEIVDPLQLDKCIPTNIECIEILDSEDESEENVLNRTSESPPPLERQSPTPPKQNINRSSPPHLQAEVDISNIPDIKSDFPVLNKLTNEEDNCQFSKLVKVNPSPPTVAKTMKMQSVLKSSIMPKTYSVRNNEKQPKVISDMKIVKTSTGQYVLVKDSSKTEIPESISSTKKATRFVIQSNSILSVSSISDINNIPRRSENDSLCKSSTSSS